MSTRNLFIITRGRGFHLPLPNGYAVSVQFGPANYADNYNEEIHDEVGSGKRGSTTAECAVLSPDDGLVDLPDEFGNGSTVTNRSTPAEVLALINWAASLPSINEDRSVK